MCACSGRVWLFVTPWTVARQVPLSLEFSRQETHERIAISFSRGFSQPRDWTCVSCISAASAGRCFITCTAWEAHGASHTHPENLAEAAEQQQQVTRAFVEAGKGHWGKSQILASDFASVVIMGKLLTPSESLRFFSCKKMMPVCCKDVLFYNNMWKYQHFVAPPPPPVSLFISAFLPEIMFCSRQCSGFYEQMHMINSKYKLLKGVSLSGKKSWLQVLSEIWKLMEFLGGLMVRTLNSHCQELGFNPWSEN